MDRWKRYCWTLLSSSAVSAGMQLIMIEKALAHEGHEHRKEADSETPFVDEQHMPVSETTTSGSSKPSEMEKMSISDAEADETSIEEIPVAQESPIAVSPANTTQGFSIGLGESLLGIIIAAPFLLVSLKKQIQS